MSVICVMLLTFQLREVEIVYGKMWLTFLISVSVILNVYVRQVSLESLRQVIKD